MDIRRIPRRKKLHVRYKRVTPLDKWSVHLELTAQGGARGFVEALGYQGFFVTLSVARDNEASGGAIESCCAISCCLFCQ